MLVTTSEKLMEEVEYEVQRQLALLSRWEIAEKSLANSKLILVKDMDEAIALTNEYAPEHLIIEPGIMRSKPSVLSMQALYFWVPCRRRVQAITHREPIIRCPQTVMPKLMAE